MLTPPLQQVGAPARFRAIEALAISSLCLVLPTAGAVYLSPHRGWFVVALSMIVYLLFLGRWISGRPLGVLVNERNLMSLSRFQMLSWTVLLLSAFFTVALKRLHVLSANHTAMPLNIAMEWRLWALMRISATSLVGPPLLLSSKATQSPDQKTIDKAASLLNEPAAAIQANSQGKLYSNAKMSDASLMDMFQGDDLGGHRLRGCLEASNVLLHRDCDPCVFVRSVLGNGKYLSPERVFNASAFGRIGCVLAISHAAYLTSKTTQHS